MGPGLWLLRFRPEAPASREPWAPGSEWEPGRPERADKGPPAADSLPPRTRARLTPAPGAASRGRRAHAASPGTASRGGRGSPGLGLQSTTSCELPLKKPGDGLVASESSPGGGGRASCPPNANKAGCCPLDPSPMASAGQVAFKMRICSRPGVGSSSREEGLPTGTQTRRSDHPTHSCSPPSGVPLGPSRAGGGDSCRGLSGLAGLWSERGSGPTAGDGGHRTVPAWRPS